MKMYMFQYFIQQLMSLQCFALFTYFSRVQMSTIPLYTQPKYNTENSASCR